jgi:hypothetical protein
MNIEISKLQDHSVNFVVGTRAMFDLATSVNAKKYPFDKKELLLSANKHIQGIRSVYDKIDKEKVERLEDFCVFALQTPSKVDYKWLSALWCKYEDVKEVIIELRKTLESERNIKNFLCIDEDFPILEKLIRDCGRSGVYRHYYRRVCHEFFVGDIIWVGDIDKDGRGYARFKVIKREYDFKKDHWLFYVDLAEDNDIDSEALSHFLSIYWRDCPK